MTEMEQWVERQFEHAVKGGVEDLYFWPKSQHVRLVERRHQNFTVVDTLSFEKMQQIIVYLKYLANMDVAETQKIQMGACSLQLQSGEIRIRLSIVPDYQRRESLVIRLLPKKSVQEVPLFPPKSWERLSAQPLRRGLYLFVGPTGSGKTTLMYRLAREQAGKQAHIISIEDPVEIREEAFLQLQVNEKQALTYETLIKVCLRQRPDVLIVGEIRDSETAKMVLRASLTGHVVLSTLHAEHSGQVLSRLAELGVVRSAVERVLQGVVTQRICENASFLSREGVQQQRFGGLVSWTSKLDELDARGWIKAVRRGWYCGFLSEMAYWHETAQDTAEV